MVPSLSFVFVVSVFFLFSPFVLVLGDPHVIDVITLPAGDHEAKKSTITATDQLVTFSTATYTLPVYKDVITTDKNGNKSKVKKVIKIDKVVETYYVSYANIGANLIKGYPGSGLKHGSADQVLRLRRCINGGGRRNCKEYRRTRRAKPTTSKDYHQQPVSTTGYAPSAGMYTFPLVEETAVPAQITDAPRIISYTGRNEVFQTAGEYSVELDLGEYRTIKYDNRVSVITIRNSFHYTFRVHSGPTTIFFPGNYQNFPQNGPVHITIQPGFAITTYINAPGTYNFNTVINNINNYYITNNYQTIQAGSTLPPLDPVTKTIDGPTVTVSTGPGITNSPDNIGPIIIGGKNFRYEGCGHPKSIFYLVLTDKKMTIERCLIECTGAVRAGINGESCYCSDAQVEDPSDKPGVCSIPCPGDLSEICGGGADLVKRQNIVNININVYFVFYLNLSNLQLTTTSTSTSTSTTTTSDMSQDLDQEPTPVVRRASVLEARKAKGGILRAAAEEEKKAPTRARKRDFGIHGPAYI